MMHSYIDAWCTALNQPDTNSRAMEPAWWLCRTRASSMHAAVHANLMLGAQGVVWRTMSRSSSDMSHVRVTNVGVELIVTTKLYYWQQQRTNNAIYYRRTEKHNHVLAIYRNTMLTWQMAMYSVWVHKLMRFATTEWRWHERWPLP